MKLHHYGYLLLIISTLFACRKDKKEDNTTDKKEKKEQQLPKAETLPNFDNSYVGAVGTQPVQLNLRRYGNQASGTYWLRGNDSVEFQLSGQYNDDNTFSLTVYDAMGKNIANPQQIATFNGKSLNDLAALEGTWKNIKGEKKLSLKKIDSKVKSSMKIDNVKTEKKSPKGDRLVDISYPRLAGMADVMTMNKVNRFIRDYFSSNTYLNSINDESVVFKEDVNYRISCFDQDNISIVKQHHISKNNDTHVVDDSHGVNMNIKKGKIYELQDLFKPNAIDQLNKIILDNINQSCSGSLDEKQLAGCRLKLNEIYSFAMEETKRDGLKITFHLTERLPYKIRGCGYVKIRYDDLKEVINPSGPLDAIQARLMKQK